MSKRTGGVHGFAVTMPGGGRRHYVVWGRGVAGFYFGGQLFGCNLSLNLSRQRWILEIWGATQSTHFRSICLQWHARDGALPPSPGSA